MCHKQNAEDAVTLEQVKQYLSQALHGFVQDPPSTKYQTGYLAALREMKDFFKFRD